MRSFHFDAAGVSRTYLDFYLGFGYIIGVYMLTQAVALWQLASMAKIDPSRVRPLIGSFLLACLVFAFLSWRFIFVVPVVSFIAVAVCLGLAFYAAGERTMSPPHFHPEERYIAVLKGTWWVGAGPKWDRSATTPVPAGSFVVHHPNKIHYDGAKDEELRRLPARQSTLMRMTATKGSSSVSSAA